MSARTGDKPEVQLILGCCTVAVLGGICHWMLVQGLWTIADERGYNDWDAVLVATVLAAVAAPLVVPVTGFIALTFLRMCWRGLPLFGRNPVSDSEQVRDDSP